MINFSKIPNRPIWGRLLRLPLNLIPKNLALPISQGPNKGYRWVKGSGVNGYWLGSYENKKANLVAEKTEEGMICYDIGGHAGYYSLLFSRSVGGGEVYTFEPDPSNLLYLQKNLEINQVENVRVLPFALGEHNHLSFFRPQSSMGKLVDRKERLVVPVFAIDNLVGKKDIPSPQIVKIDVEGAELGVLRGMRTTLNNNKPVVFVALDDQGTKDEVAMFLKELGYKIEKISQTELYASHRD